MPAEESSGRGASDDDARTEAAALAAQVAEAVARVTALAGRQTVEPAASWSRMACSDPGSR